MLADGFPDQVMQFFFKILSAFQPVRVLFQALRHGGVQHDIAAGDTVGGTQ